MKRQFDHMIMEDSESIMGFSHKFTSMVGEIRSLGTELKGNIVVEKLFSRRARQIPDDRHDRAVGRCLSDVFIRGQGDRALEGVPRRAPRGGTMIMDSWSW